MHVKSTALVALVALVALGSPLVTAFHVAPTPSLAIAEARVSDVLTGHPVQGRSASEWIGFARDDVAHASPGPAHVIGLEPAVLSLYAAMGVVPTDAERATLARDAAAVDPAVAAPFASLVADVATAYAAQTPIAARVMDAAHAAFGEGMAPPIVMPANPLATNVAPFQALLTPEDAKASADNAMFLLHSIATFRANVPIEPSPVAGAPTFRDPLGVVQLGGSDDTLYPRNGQFKDSVLIADSGGDDTYYVSAGGACPDSVLNQIATCNGLALSVNVDLAGNDLYSFDGLRVVAQGAASTGAVGILADFGGDDSYLINSVPERDSFVEYYISGVEQGAGQASFGLLLDTDGNDQYTFYAHAPHRQAYALGQGYAGLGGIGLIVDLAGNDRYVATVDTPLDGGFGGVYTLGTGLYGGVAVAYDQAGDDFYGGYVVLPQADFYAAGFGGFNGLGVQVDAAGNDAYVADERSTNESFGQSLNCAYGTAFWGGVGGFADLGGDDSYLTVTTSFARSGTPSSMSEGWSEGGYSFFVDTSGADDHVIQAFGLHPMTMGRGAHSNTLNELGFFNVPVLGAGATYLDLGGVDTYEGADPSADDSVWMWGVDANAVPALPGL